VTIPKTTNERQLELVLELAVREAQESFWCFRQFMHPNFNWGWWQYEVADYLQKFVEEYRLGRRPKLVLQCPPQHGKSELMVDLIAWCLGHDPNIKIIFASFSDRLGLRANHKLQRILTSDKFKLVFGTRINEGGSTLVNRIRNNEMIEIRGATGYFRNTTVGGPITGESLDIGVIDDPIKGSAEAHSRPMRDKTSQWFTDDFMTRFSDQGALLIVMTRWHIDDLVGRLLRKDPKVKELRYPALAEADERFRKKGEALFPEFKSPDFLLERKRAMPESSWQALYQQNPIVVGGGLFPIERIGVIPVMPNRGQIKMSVRAWDKGATAGGGDYTVGVLMLAMKDGTFVVADVIRGQWSALDRERVIKAAADRDRKMFLYQYEIVIEQEPGSSGKESLEATTRALAGFVVRADRVTGSKTIRAEPFAAQVQGGNIFLQAGFWNQAYRDELECFPSGAHDDQVDASTAAFNRLVAGLSYNIEAMQ
jgi:predicted phage terminase large subunit-like protein